MPTAEFHEVLDAIFTGPSVGADAKKQAVKQVLSRQASVHHLPSHIGQTNRPHQLARGASTINTNSLAGNGASGFATGPTGPGPVSGKLIPKPTAVQPNGIPVAASSVRPGGPHLVDEDPTTVGRRRHNSNGDKTETPVLAPVKPIPIAAATAAAAAVTTAEPPSPVSMPPAAASDAPAPTTEAGAALSLAAAAAAAVARTQHPAEEQPPAQPVASDPQPPVAAAAPVVVAAEVTVSPPSDPAAAPTAAPAVPPVSATATAAAPAADESADDDITKSIKAAYIALTPRSKQAHDTAAAAGAASTAPAPSTHPSTLAPPPAAVPAASHVRSTPTPPLTAALAMADELETDATNADYGRDLFLTDGTGAGEEDGTASVSRKGSAVTLVPAEPSLKQRMAEAHAAAAKASIASAGSAAEPPGPQQPNSGRQDHKHQPNTTAGGGGGGGDDLDFGTDDDAPATDADATASPAPGATPAVAPTAVSEPASANPPPADGEGDPAYDEDDDGEVGAAAAAGGEGTAAAVSTQSASASPVPAHDQSTEQTLNRLASQPTAPSNDEGKSDTLAATTKPVESFTSTASSSEFGSGHGKLLARTNGSATNASESSPVPASEPATPAVVEAATPAPVVGDDSRAALLRTPPIGSGVSDSGSAMPSARGDFSAAKVLIDAVAPKEDVKTESSPAPATDDSSLAPTIAPSYKRLSVRVPAAGSLASTVNESNTGTATNAQANGLNTTQPIETVANPTPPHESDSSRQDVKLDSTHRLPGATPKNGADSGSRSDSDADQRAGASRGAAPSAGGGSDSSPSQTMQPHRSPVRLLASNSTPLVPGGESPATVFAIAAATAPSPSPFPTAPSPAPPVPLAPRGPPLDELPAEERERVFLNQIDLLQRKVAVAGPAGGGGGDDTRYYELHTAYNELQASFNTRLAAERERADRAMATRTSFQKDYKLLLDYKKDTSAQIKWFEEQQHSHVNEMNRLEQLCAEQQHLIANLKQQLEAGVHHSAAAEEVQHRAQQQQNWLHQQSIALQQRFETERADLLGKVTKERTERDAQWSNTVRAWKQRVVTEKIARLKAERAQREYALRAANAERQVSTMLSQANLMATAANGGSNSSSAQLMVAHQQQLAQLAAAEWKKQSSAAAAQIAAYDAQIEQLSSGAAVINGESMGGAGGRDGSMDFESPTAESQPAAPAAVHFALPAVAGASPSKQQPTNSVANAAFALAAAQKAAKTSLQQKIQNAKKSILDRQPSKSPVRGNHAVGGAAPARGATVAPAAVKKRSGNRRPTAAASAVKPKIKKKSSAPVAAAAKPATAAATVGVTLDDAFANPYDSPPPAAVRQPRTSIDDLQLLFTPPAAVPPPPLAAVSYAEQQQNRAPVLPPLLPLPFAMQQQSGPPPPAYMYVSPPQQFHSLGGMNGYGTQPMMNGGYGNGGYGQPQPQPAPGSMYPYAAAAAYNLQQQQQRMQEFPPYGAASTQPPPYAALRSHPSSNEWIRQNPAPQPAPQHPHHVQRPSPLAHHHTRAPPPAAPAAHEKDGGGGSGEYDGDHEWTDSQTIHEPVSDAYHNRQTHHTHHSHHHSSSSSSPPETYSPPPPGVAAAAAAAANIRSRPIPSPSPVPSVYSSPPPINRHRSVGALPAAVAAALRPPAALAAPAPRANTASPIPDKAASAAPGAPQLPQSRIPVLKGSTLHASSPKHAASKKAAKH